MKIIARIYWIICFIFSFLAVIAQQEPVLDISFDDCTATDLANGFDGTLTGSPVCECGVLSDAMTFDGTDDFITFPDSLNSFILEEFTLSFYMILENSDPDPVDIISHRASCERDSSFAIRYIPVTNQISVEFGESPSRITEVTGTLNNPECWNHIVITKSDNRLTLYINSRLAGSEIYGIPLVVKSGEQLAISNSPCIGFTDQRFTGVVDELRLYGSAINEFEVADFNIHPDRIVSNDTTIIAGNSVEILTGGTCSENFIWTPASSLTATDTPFPVATPGESTVYTWTVRNRTCTIVDSVRINVVNEGDVLCENLLLPNAFTPNMDSVNDEFGISNVFLIEQLTSFRIFDKWGSEIFSTAEKNMKWDGTFNGTLLNPGTYIYKIRYTCGAEDHFKSGSFVLIR